MEGQERQDNKECTKLNGSMEDAVDAMNTILEMGRQIASNADVSNETDE